MVWGLNSSKKQPEQKQESTVFDSDNVADFIDNIDDVKAADENDFGIIEEGWYPAIFSKIEPKQTPNAHMVDVAAEILATQFKGRKVFSNFITHLAPREGKDPEKQAKAVTIGRAKFKSLLVACNNARKFSEAIGVPCLIKVGVDKARTGDDGKEYPARNKIELCKPMTAEQLAQLESGEDPSQQKPAAAKSSKPKFMK